MTATDVETITKPELDSPRGMYGSARINHVRNLLSRANAAGSATELTPEVIRKMRRHYQVASCLTVQALPLIRADWSIECEDDDHRERLTSAYEAVAFHAHRSMTKALPHGYSPNEVVWTYRNDLKLICPSEIRDLEPRTCKPDTDETGSLDGMTQTAAGGTEDFEPIYTLWIVEGMESGNYYGRSILDAALEPWQDYAAIRAFHARYLERFGEPLVVCRAPQGTSITNAVEINRIVTANTEAELSPGDEGYQAVPEPRVENNLDTALDTGQNIRHHSVVALPSTLLYGTDGKPTGFAWQLEFLESKGGKGADFVEALRELDKRIARAMFVPDLLTSNTEDTGSNALGQTHRDVWEDAVEGRLDDFSRQITDQLIEPIRILNFGADSPPARLVFAPLSDAAKDRAWALIMALVTTGKIPVDVRELASSLEIPLTDEGDQLEEPTPEPDPPVGQSRPRRATALGIGEGANGGIDAPGSSLEPLSTLVAATNPQGGWTEILGHAFTIDPVANMPAWKIPQALNEPGVYRRDLNDREKRVGFAKLETGLNDAERGTLAAIEEILDDEHDRLLRQLKAIVRKGSAREILAALGTLEIKSGSKVATAWANLMRDVSMIAVEQLHAELAAHAASLPDDVGASGRALFTAYAQTTAERVVTSLVTETRLRLLNAYTSGVTSRPGLAAVVGQVFDEYQQSEGKPVRLTTRMLSAKSLNYSRAAAVELGGIPLAGAQYSSLLDLKVCDLCERLDEHVIAITNTDLAKFTPPVHHNCRCVWVWITRDEADFTADWSTPPKSLIERFGGLIVD